MSKFDKKAFKERLARASAGKPPRNSDPAARMAVERAAQLAALRRLFPQYPFRGRMESAMILPAHMFRNGEQPQAYEACNLVAGVIAELYGWEESKRLMPHLWRAALWAEMPMSEDRNSVLDAQFTAMSRAVVEWEPKIDAVTIVGDPNSMQTGPGVPFLISRPEKLHDQIARALRDIDTPAEENPAAHDTGRARLQGIVEALACVAGPQLAKEWLPGRVRKVAAAVGTDAAPTEWEEFVLDLLDLLEEMEELEA